MELTLLANALTAAVGVWAANRLLAGRITVERPTDALLGAAAVGLAVGRLAAMIGAGVNPLLRPGDILIVRAGVSTGFATLGALGLLAWTYRDRLPIALDQLTPGALAGLAGWHGGCLWRGTCLGVVSDVPWAMTSAGTSITRHPVELYAALGFVVTAVAASRLVARPWVATGFGIAAAGAVRATTEPLRVSISGGPMEWYLAAIVFGTVLAVFAQIRMRTVPPGPSSIDTVPP